VLDHKESPRGHRRFRGREWKLRAPARFRKERLLADVVFTLITVAFFVIAILYLRGCERLR
jgi:hypothetical protein